MGGWAGETIGARASNLLRVQTHRLTASHSDGGANHAQRRRFGNMELLLYGREGVHLGHLQRLETMTTEMPAKAAATIQFIWRLQTQTRRLARQAGISIGRSTRSSTAAGSQHGVVANAFLMSTMMRSVEAKIHEGVLGAEIHALPTPKPATRASGGSSPSARRESPGHRSEAEAAAQPASPTTAAAPVEPLDRALLQQMSVGLPDFA